MNLGGMSTPLGIYITDGRNRFGSLFGTFLSGFLMGLLSILSLMTTNVITLFNPYLESIHFILLPIFFFGYMRYFTNLTENHAVEHQLINLLESEEDINLENIKKQPRYHERCGTNLFCFIMMVHLFIKLCEYFNLNTIITIVSLVVFTWFWIEKLKINDKIGKWIQNNITTKQADDKKYLKALELGKTIKSRYDENKKPNLIQSVLNSCIFNVIIGYIIFMELFKLI